jgi:hypothetical protein
MTEPFFIDASGTPAKALHLRSNGAAFAQDLAPSRIIRRDLYGPLPQIDGTWITSRGGALNGQ